MDQVQKAMQFAKLHAKGTPVRLYNAWDAGSAKAIADGGPKPSQVAVGLLRQLKAIRTAKTFQ
jgi:2-methylisocitrate lyase-like PEP mutase family enzyme